MKHLIFIILIGIAWVTPVSAGAPAFIDPSPKDKCPVCGMFVAKYPDFIAEIVFNDGSYAVFDGAKDMFKYFLNLDKYAVSKKQSDIVAIFVTDYYGLEKIDGLEAFYILGSDVFGPMGRELIPFKNQAEAKGFMTDHRGKSIVRFNAVTREMLKGLD